MLFVCTGNYYRSRLAEALFRHGSASDRNGWDAFSRGLAVAGTLRGLAREARDFLEFLGIPADLRNPLPLLVDELISADHVVILNRAEHEPVISAEFRAVYRRLLEKNAVTCWNVFDLPARKPAWGKAIPPTQPAASATEHICFAVKDLLRQLLPPGNSGR
ncbi:MAG: hypothetical protein WCS65_00660 [Verrucomicrobiae bacterium]